MVNFPFYRYPYSYYYRNPGFQNIYNKTPAYTFQDSTKNSSNYSNIEDYISSNKSQENQEDSCKIENSVQADKKKTSRYNSFGPINFQNPFSADYDKPVLELLGIQLYLDDIIILSLLFFLYKEEVKDEMLFISLILLLLS